MSNLQSTADIGQPRTPWWLWVNILSLDAPLIAVLFQAALAKAYHVTLPLGCYVTLWMAVWLIYVLDRTLDGYSSDIPPKLSARHAFYRRHRRLFMIGIIPCMIMITAWLAWTAIPMLVMFRGVVLAFVVGLYLLHYAARSNRTFYIAGNAMACIFGSLLIWPLPILPSYKVLYTFILVGLLILSVVGRTPTSFRLIPKELLCGYFFAVGCSLNVHFYTLDEYASPASMVTIMFGLLCALNCISISCAERVTDNSGDPNVITLTWPWIPRFYPLLLIATAGLGMYFLHQHIHRELVIYSIAVFGSLILLALVHHFATRLRPELSRVLADAALAVPMIIVLALVV